jgi:hypothetical protein
LARRCTRMGGDWYLAGTPPVCPGVPFCKSNMELHPTLLYVANSSEAPTGWGRLRPGCAAFRKRYRLCSDKLQRLKNNDFARSIEKRPKCSGRSCFSLRCAEPFRLRFVAEAPEPCGFPLTPFSEYVYTYCTMKRTTIFLTPDQVKKLAKTATQKGINPAQLIRIYINAGLDKEKS